MDKGIPKTIKLDKAKSIARMVHVEVEGRPHPTLFNPKTNRRVMFWNDHDIEVLSTHFLGKLVRIDVAEDLAKMALLGMKYQQVEHVGDDSYISEDIMPQIVEDCLSNETFDLNEKSLLFQRLTYMN